MHERAYSPPWLLRNGHVQTLLGHFWPDQPFTHPSEPHVISLADGDQVVAHDSLPEGWHPGKPMALLLHGLGGSHASNHICRIARHLLHHNVRVVRMDLRGAGAGLTLARKTYHGGCSSDVRAVLRAMSDWSMNSPLWLLGISLGGNIALKLAGETDHHPVPNLARVAAISPPVDMLRCAAMLGRASNRLYEWFFVRELLEELRIREDHFPDLPRLRFPSRPTMRMFDDLYTAPQHGFASALDYYRRVSSLPLLERIRVPAFLITARDDPFIAVQPFETLRLPDHIQVRILQHGGHLGFLGQDEGNGGLRWAEKCVLDWFLQSAHPSSLADRSQWQPSEEQSA